MTGFPRNWIEAARYERDRRAAKFPAKVAAGEIDGDFANADYQAWCAIAEWLEQGKAGWSTSPIVMMIGWAAMEEAAEKQLANIEERIAAGGMDPAKASQQRERRDAIWCIHNLMVKQRELVEPTTRKNTAWARAPEPLTA